MAKSLKSLHKGADKRAQMKNKDGSPIHYDQVDRAPVFEETVPHQDLKAWRRHAKAVGGFVEDHGTHLEAWDEKHKKIGHFHPEAGHGYIHDERPGLMRRQAEGYLPEMSHHSKYHEWLNDVMQHGASKFEEHQNTIPHYQDNKKEKHHHTLAMNHQGHIVGSWNHKYNYGMVEQVEIVESLDQLYPIFEEAGLFEANGTIEPKHAYGAKEHLQLNKLAAGIIKKKEGNKQKTATDLDKTLNAVTKLQVEDTLIEGSAPKWVVHNTQTNKPAKFVPTTIDMANRWKERLGSDKHTVYSHSYWQDKIKPTMSEDTIVESRYGAGLPVNVSTHNPQTCRACQHLSKSGRFKTLGDLNKHAQEYPHIHGSYATDKTGKKIAEASIFDKPNLVHRINRKRIAAGKPPLSRKEKAHLKLKRLETITVPVDKLIPADRPDLKEDTLIEAGSSKTAMKRKYLGKSKGRTQVGTKAHPIDVKPKIVFKDVGAMGRMATSKMPLPTSPKGW